MANCSVAFTDFNQKIRLTDNRRANLLVKRKSSRDRISGGYILAKSMNKIEIQDSIQFHSQGSFEMDTIVNPYNKDEEYDLDDGVYFIGLLSKEQRRKKEQSFHDAVIASLENGQEASETEEISDKPSCVRVSYRAPGNDYNYHIDLPIYYASNIVTPELAHTIDGWKDDNPIAFMQWFEDRAESGFLSEYITNRGKFENEFDIWQSTIRRNDVQIRRIVRYLKAWSHHKSINDDILMPSGIALTVMVGNNYQRDYRDDKALLLSLKSIRQWINDNGNSCPMPTSADNEDLIDNLSSIEKQSFLSVLDDIVRSGEQALKTEFKKDACNKWRYHFGDRFSCSGFTNDIKDAKVHGSAAVIKSYSGKSA